MAESLENDTNHENNKISKLKLYQKAKGTSLKNDIKLETNPNTFTRKVLKLLLLSAFTGLLWSCCGSKVSMSGRPKKERGWGGGVAREKREKKCKRERTKGAFPLSSSIPSPFSNPPLTPWIPAVRASVK